MNPGRDQPIAEAASLESPMIALAVIFGFIAILAAINFFEFGRVD